MWTGPVLIGWLPCGGRHVGGLAGVRREVGAVRFAARGRNVLGRPRKAQGASRRRVGTSSVAGLAQVGKPEQDGTGALDEETLIGPALPDDATVNLVLDLALRVGEVLMASGA